MRDAPIVGTDAPDFVLHAEGGRVITTLRARRPRVLAFVRGWSIARARDADLRAIRAELRGLGADLTILSDAAVWSFRPDDDVELCAGGTVHITRELAAAARDWGVDGDRDAVFVIDHDGLIRFAHVSDVPLALALGDALATASAAVHAKPRPTSFTRREWTLTCLIAGLTVTVLPACRSHDEERPRAMEARVPHRATAAPAMMEIELVVNGAHRKLSIDPRASLLDTLRDRLGLTGTKKGCDAGQCGACTVLLGGKRVVSCLTLAALAQGPGKDITTIEGLAHGDELHPLQAAFVEHDALQCGFCTPGQIMSAAGLLAEGHTDLADDDQLREHMSGNLCRCGAYPNIVTAIRTARSKGA